MDGTTQKREASLMFLLPLGCVFFFGFRSLPSQFLGDRFRWFFFSKVLADLDRVKFSVLPLDGSGGIEMRVLDDSQ